MFGGECARPKPMKGHSQLRQTPSALSLSRGWRGRYQAIGEGLGADIDPLPEQISPSGTGPAVEQTRRRAHPLACQKSTGPRDQRRFFGKPTDARDGPVCSTAGPVPDGLICSGNGSISAPSPPPIAWHRPRHRPESESADGVCRSCACLSSASAARTHRRAIAAPGWAIPGGRMLACRKWGQRQTGYCYLSIPSGSCCCRPMICALVPLYGRPKQRFSQFGCALECGVAPSPTPDVPSHTSGAAMCQQRTKKAGDHENNITIPSCSKPLITPRAPASFARSGFGFRRRRIDFGDPAEASASGRGPETKVPPTLVEYQPDTTPSRSELLRS